MSLGLLRRKQYTTRILLNSRRRLRWVGCARLEARGCNGVTGDDVVMWVMTVGFSVWGSLCLKLQLRVGNDGRLLAGG